MNETQSNERVPLHSDVVQAFLTQVAAATVTPEEQKLRSYQRLLIARTNTAKKVNNIQAAIRGKAQELQHERDLLRIYEEQIARLERELTI